MARKRTLARRNRRYRRLRWWYDFLTLPIALVFMTNSLKVDRKYGMNWPRRMWLGFRFWRNEQKMITGTSWRAHLAMAMRLLETPASMKGNVVECGCYKGGATVNLSLACAAVGRELRVYDSFEGLPPPTKGDHVAERAFKDGFIPRVFKGGLEEVGCNVRKYGNINVCRFHKGWYKDTLPRHEGPIAFAFWDVDHYDSLHDCLLNLWPWLQKGAYLFMDEYRNMSYSSVFFSEKYWDKYFSDVPPGLIGIGTGIQVGMFYTDRAMQKGHPTLGRPRSTAYTRKGERAFWDFYPEEGESADERENLARAG